jgi:heterodisulfide reductase subunit A
MVVLSIGLKPSVGSNAVQKYLTLARTSGGFFMVAHPKLRPVDTATRGVFLAGCSEGPKDIKEAVTQASAAASRASILMSGGKVKVEAITAKIREENCVGCGACTKVCPYNAIQLNDQKKAVVIAAACSGCGTCSAECKFEAIEMRHFTDEQILSQIDAFTEHEPEKKILAFNCNWCSYAGADFAGIGRMQYAPEVRIIRTMCSGRVAKSFIEHAFARGVGMVLLSGCHIGDCHYIDANTHALNRFNQLQRLMKKNGLDPERLQLVWVSAAEGQKFQEKVNQMAGTLKAVTPDEIKNSMRFFREREKSRREKTIKDI